MANSKNVSNSNLMSLLSQLPTSALDNLVELVQAVAAVEAGKQSDRQQVIADALIAGDHQAMGHELPALYPANTIGGAAHSPRTWTPEQESRYDYYWTWLDHRALCGLD